MRKIDDSDTEDTNVIEKYEKELLQLDLITRENYTGETRIYTSGTIIGDTVSYPAFIALVRLQRQVNELQKQVNSLKKNSHRKANVYK